MRGASYGAQPSRYAAYPPASVPALAGTKTLCIALALVVSGFPFVAAASELIDVISTPISIGVRAMTAAVSLLLLIGSARADLHRAYWLIVSCAAAFWALFLTRMVTDTLLVAHAIRDEPASYWVWAVGGSLIPLLGLACARFTPQNATPIFRTCFGLTLVTVFLALPSLSSMVETAYGSYNSGRASLTALNPISLGHLGVQLVIMSLWALILRARIPGPFGVAIFGGAALVGMYLTIVANSRGPLVSLFVAAMFALLASNLRRKYWLIGLSVVALLAFAPTVAVVDQIAGTQVYDRMFGQSQLDEVSTVIRFELYTSAWNQFLANPLTGSGLEDPVFGGYPHNLLIEAFMATGVFGGTLLIAVFVMSCYAAYRVLRIAPAYGWLALLTVQQIVGAQFSGSIGQATVMWGLIGALAAVVGIASAQRRLAPPRAYAPQGSGSRPSPGYRRLQPRID